MSLFGAVRTSLKNVDQSHIFHATTISTAASVVIGISAAVGISTSSITRRVTLWTIPAIGVRPPFLTFAAVLAIAPVAGIPPKRPENIFPTP